MPVSMAGVDQTAAPAYPLGQSDCGIVHVFLRTEPVAASRRTKLPWKASRTLSPLSSAEPPDTPMKSMPSKSTGLPYTSEPGWVSMGAELHRRAPVASSRAMTYGPWQELPEHAAPLATLETAT